MSVTEEAKKMEEAVVEETSKILSGAKQLSEKILVEITSEEKLVIRTIEVDFLKAQMEAQRMATALQTKQKEYNSTVEGLVKKYTVDPLVYVFDSVDLVFKKK